MNEKQRQSSGNEEEGGVEKEIRKRYEWKEIGGREEEGEDGKSTIVLEELAIPTEIPLQSLLCSVTDDGRWLYVQEQPSVDDQMVLDYSGTTSKFLPIIKVNTMTSQLEIFLRLAAEFDADDVTVKTVDDSVVITGNKRPGSLTFDDDVTSGDRPSSPGSGGHLTWLPAAAAVPHFLVIVPLPSGVESRTVSALVAPKHQLVITGRLRPTSRRYSF